MPSLHQAYDLAHTASCRLELEAARPDRNLRFLVGHLMHYEAMRLHIVEVEHDVGRRKRERERQRAAVDQLLRARGRRNGEGEDDADEDDGEDDDSEDDDLLSGGSSSKDEDDDLEDKDAGADKGYALRRFSNSASEPPDLVKDDGDVPCAEEDRSEPVSPEQPDHDTLQRVVNGEATEELKVAYNGVSKCPCHGEDKNAPQFERMWDWPRKEGEGNDGSRRMVAEVRTK